MAEIKVDNLSSPDKKAEGESGEQQNTKLFSEGELATVGDEEESGSMWSEVCFPSKLPGRRAYHASFYWNGM
jgi:hypothetical protein